MKYYYSGLKTNNEEVTYCHVLITKKSVFIHDLNKFNYFSILGFSKP